jgi:hypothetical protein
MGLNFHFTLVFGCGIVLRLSSGIREIALDLRIVPATFNLNPIHEFLF